MIHGDKNWQNGVLCGDNNCGRLLMERRTIIRAQRAAPGAVSDVITRMDQESTDPDAPIIPHALPVTTTHAAQGDGSMPNAPAAIQITTFSEVTPGVGVYTPLL